MNKFSIGSDRAFFARFFRMTFIIAAQNSIVLGVNLADNIMLGRYTEIGLSGVSIANQIQFLLQMFAVGIGEGLVVISSRAWGKGEREPIRRVLAVCLWIGIGAAALMMIPVFFATGWTYNLFTPDAEIASVGAEYIRVVCFSYIPFCISQLLLASLRSSGQVRIGVEVSVAALLTNVTLNYLLIFGNFGFPELGVRGAAIATLISRCVELAVIIIYIVFREKHIGYRLRGIFTFDNKILREWFAVGSPVLICSVLWGVAMAIQSGILGRLGNEALTANNIANTVFQFISVVTYASASGASVVLGNSIGAGELDMIRRRVRTFQWLFIIIGAVTAVVLLALTMPIISFYKTSEETRRLSIQFMFVQCVTVVGTSYQMPVFSGLMRAGGDTSFQMFNDIIFMWGIVLPASMLAAFVFKWGVLAVFICLKSDQITKCFVAAIKVNRFNWLHIGGKKVPIPQESDTPYKLAVSKGNA